jgi:transcriptional regulator with XRE-family HTH domain
MRKPSLPRSRKDLALLVGSRIKKLRLERRWSESDLAALLSLPPALIRTYETGAALPRSYTLYVLTLVFETSAGAFLDESSPAARDPHLQRLLARLEALESDSRTAATYFLDTFIAGLERLAGLWGRTGRDQKTTERQPLEEIPPMPAASKKRFKKRQRL